MKVKMEGGSGERRIGDISLLGYFSRRSLGTFLSVVGDLTSPPFPHDETEKWGGWRGEGVVMSGCQLMRQWIIRSTVCWSLVVHSSLIVGRWPVSPSNWPFVSMVSLVFYFVSLFAVILKWICWTLDRPVYELMIRLLLKAIWFMWTSSQYLFYVILPKYS